jgi:hypothetical protein
LLKLLQELEELFHGTHTTAKKQGASNLALMLPKSVKELHRFFGMVQYYRDIWA